MKGTVMAIRCEGKVLTRTRVRSWNLDGNKLTNAHPIYFPRAEYNWPIPDEIACFDDMGNIFSRSKLPPEYVVEEGYQPTIAQGDYEIILLPEENEP